MGHAVMDCLYLWGIRKSIWSLSLAPRESFVTRIQYKNLT